MAEQEPNLRKRLVHAGLARVFSEVPERSAEWHAGLEGWDVEQSAIMEHCRTVGRVGKARRLTLRVLSN